MGTLGMGLPKIRGTTLGIPIMRIIVYWGLYNIGVPLFWKITENAKALSGAYGGNFPYQHF